MINFEQFAYAACIAFCMFGYGYIFGLMKGHDSGARSANFHRDMEDERRRKLAAELDAAREREAP
ncbi:MAG: hypothetical protein KDA69_12215 [Planctomycetaceae bacterium]|nr:hypothetical protein [Planctomycetaceae bacterium]